MAPIETTKNPLALPSQADSSVRSVERAFGLLRALESAGRPRRLTDLIEETGMPKATVQRLLGVLEKSGFVEKQDGRYQVGVAAVPLAYSFLVGNSLTRAALPVLQELAAVSEETATLYVRHGRDRVVVQRVEGKNPPRYSMPVVVGQRITLLLGAAGHVLAAAMPEAELGALLEHAGEIRTAGGKLVTEEQLRTRLDQVSREGFAVSLDERTLGVVSVAAPVIVGGRGTIASLAVTGLARRLGATRIEQLSLEVRHAARAIAERYSRTAG